jgi:putative transposase
VSFKSNRNVVYSCQYHAVFCPKYRRKVLVPPIDERLKQVIREVCTDAKSELIEMEVMPDHVHLLRDCDPQFGINRLIRSIKGRSSRLLRQEYRFLKSRLPSLWTNSYYCASVGVAPRSVIKQYIEHQKNV